MWAFAVFYSFTIAIGVESSGMDIVRYIGEVENLHSSGVELTQWYNYYRANMSIDVANSLLAFLVAQFTGNGYYLVLLFGIIYGYFFSRNMWFVIEKLHGKLKIITLVLLVCLFLVVPLWYLNTFRFWVAAHVFIFGLLPYLYSGKKHTLIWCAVTPFVFHFAFVVPLGVLFAYVGFKPFLKNSITPFFAFFVVSIFFSEINIEQFNYYVETYAPEAFAERTLGYRNFSQVYQLRSGGGQESGMVWYAALYQRGFHLSLIVFLLVLFFKNRDLARVDPNLVRILGFTYLFFGVANFMSSIPSGSRYISIAALLATAVLTIYLQNVYQEKWMKRAIFLSAPLLLLFIVVSVREGLYLTSLMTIIGNPVAAVFTIGENLSLNDVLKSWFR